MRINIEKESLINCLSWCSVRELPKEWDKKNVYIKAIAKVAKIDGSHSYVAIQKDKNGNDKIIKDFGQTAAIRKVEAVYPYLYLDAMYLPTFKNQKKEDRIAVLSHLFVGKDFSQMTLKELDRELLNYAIQMHLNAEKNKTYNEPYTLSEDIDEEEEIVEE